VKRAKCEKETRGCDLRERLSSSVVDPTVAQVLSNLVHKTRVGCTRTKDSNVGCEAISCANEGAANREGVGTLLDKRQRSTKREAVPLETQMLQRGLGRAQELAQSFQRVYRKVVSSEVKAAERQVRAQCRNQPVSEGGDFFLLLDFLPGSHPISQKAICIECRM
jgi:hypothetical protein